MTSADVVNVARRRLSEKRIGHLGTLDPLAAGVLPLAVGWATRLIPYIDANPGDAAKEYIAELLLGTTTDSQDLSGRVLREADASGIEESHLRAAMERFVGHQEQIPPMASAVHHESQRLYELFRKGIEVERTPRPMVVTALDVLRFTSPRVLFRLACSAGTYVRTICHDIGESLGCGGTMSFLVRTRSGPFCLDSAVPLEDLTPNAIVDINTILADLPGLTVVPASVNRVYDGRMLLDADFESAGETWRAGVPAVRILAPDGSFLAIAKREGEGLHPVRVLPRA